MVFTLWERELEVDVEVEKSHFLSSASWRPRKASGIIQSEDLKTRETNGTESPDSNANLT